jgi:acyl-CoA thioester hydrolase
MAIMFVKKGYELPMSDNDSDFAKDNTLQKLGETTFHVRYAETDQMGIVHHSVYPVWFEEGRSSFARQLGWPYSRFEEDGFGLAVSEVNARFVRPTRYDQAVTVRTWISQVRSRLMRFEYEVLDTETGDLLAKGYTVHICVDHDRKPARIPAAWHDFWNALVTDGSAV